MSSRPERGFVLLYVILLIFVLALAGAIALADYEIKSVKREASAGVSVGSVYVAITGDPNEDYYGYLGDVGDYPAKLADLVQAPSPPVAGWNGPYLRNVTLNNGMLLDSYGSPLEYFLNLAAGSLDQIAIVSRGPDKISSNTAANPNIASAPNPFPGNAGYPTAAGNADNIYYPDFVSNATAVNYQNAGTLAYNITAFDQNASVNALVAACPNLYTLNITSMTRSTSDTMPVAYNPNLVTDVGQGSYVTTIVGTSGRTVFTEQVSVPGGTLVTRNVVLPAIDSSQTPLVNLTIYNESTGASAKTLTVRTDSVTGGSLGTLTTGTPKRTFSVNSCRPIVLENSGTCYDSFVVPSNDYTRTVQNPPGLASPCAPPPTTVTTTPVAPYVLTVTNGGTQSDQLKVTAWGLLLGTVYKRKTRSFNVPSHPLPNMPNPAESAGTVVTITKKDGSALSSNPLVNPMTGNQSLTGGNQVP